MTLAHRSLLLLALMCATAVGAVVLRPTQKIADLRPAIELMTLVPSHFGDWREEPQQFAVVVNPQQQETLNKIYNQTLSRLYVNRTGYRIMLSVAYGGDQSDGMQIHRPEVCYPAQGFQLLAKRTATIALPFGSLLVTRLDTQLGQRREPITYWITIGNKVVRGNIEKKLAEMSYGVRGRIPDGLLFRISSIDPEIARAFEVQEGFISQLLVGVTPETRERLAGTFGEN
jgi:EpsI family protein